MVVGIDGAVGLWEISVAMIHSCLSGLWLGPFGKVRVSGRAVLLGIALNVILFYYLLRNLSTKLEQKRGREKCS